MLKTYLKTSSALTEFKDRLIRDESGASLVEYSVLIGLITVATIVLIGLVGVWVTGAWTDLEAALP